MKTLSLLPAFLLFSFTASAEVKKDCYNMADQALICIYEGETGLELFPEVELHQIQRLPVYFQGVLGSIVLIQNAQIENLTFNECWSVSHGLNKDLLLFCQQRLTDPGKFPEIIQNEVQHLRAN